MPTAAIVIDDWKLRIFKKALDEGGYQYTEHKGPTTKCLTLKVPYVISGIGALTELVKEANRKAAN